MKKVIDIQLSSDAWVLLTEITGLVLASLFVVLAVLSVSK